MENKFSYYQSPLSSRYASCDMSYLFSDENRYRTFRKLWIELAIAQKKLGLTISSDQIEQMKKVKDDIDFAKVAYFEKKFKHDVMAHIYAFGEMAPLAKPIIHLGSTSCFVTDNTDLILMKNAMSLLLNKLAAIIKLLSIFAKTHANLACVGYTHLQVAQPTTVGKRAALWLQDFLIDAKEMSSKIENLPFLGCKGATGSQNSFLQLFNGNIDKVIKLDELLSKEFGFNENLIISSQTYPRKFDIYLLNILQSFAASAHKMGTDIRLLSSFGEITEGYDKKQQIGSSAMPHKTNPIYSERICSLSRFLISLGENPQYTAATQWLERSLDDSAGRRIYIPEAFLTADSILNTLHKLVSSLCVNDKTITSNLKKHASQLLMENIIMAEVKKGGDRQHIHEKLRLLSLKLSNDNELDLASIISNDETFSLTQEEIKSLTKEKNLIGLAPYQVSLFLKKDIDPFLKRHKNKDIKFPDIEV
jgi:adenylosuccinate lyase